MLILYKEDENINHLIIYELKIFIQIFCKGDEINDTNIIHIIITYDMKIIILRNSAKSNVFINTSTNNGTNFMQKEMDIWIMEAIFSATRTTYLLHARNENAVHI